jgi:predicted ribosomally synthesized peptide with SipW-like signal peptide
MSNDFELSRRKTLAALGSIGVASAGAGLGTSAYFSDQETFENNRLVAGELDLLMDWEEHYSDWMGDENADIEEAGGGESQEDDGSGTFEVLMEEPENPDGFRQFPPGTQSEFDGQAPLLWVPDVYVDDFMANTAIEAFPDSDDDGLAEYPVGDMDGDPCEFLANVGDDDNGLDPDANENGRTAEGDSRLDNGDPAPLINLQDVKPGDFGEITFSTHLCDNPGYLWMNMPDGLTASENGVTEPEADDPDEDQVEGDGDPALKDGAEEGKTVELVEKIQTAIWYDDNCNNLFDCEEPIDVMAVADTSNSIDGELGNADTQEEIDLIAEAANIFVQELFDRSSDPSDVQAGLLTFNGAGDADEDPDQPQGVFPRPALRAGLDSLDQFFQNGTSSDPTVEQFLPAEGTGNTPTPHALDLAQTVLEDDPNARPNARKVIVLVTDGLPDYDTADNNPSIPYEVTENEGGPLTTTAETYQSDTYDTGSFSGSDSTEQDETAAEAEDVQQAGTEILVAGVGTGSTGDTFLRERVAGQDGDESTAEPNYYFNVNFPGETEAGEQPIDEAAEDLAEFIVFGSDECEKVIFQGSLQEAADELTANGGRGIPLTSNQATPFEELNDDGDDPGRECFTPGHTSCFGFSWWLPENHGNEVQSDSASFDIGFYTEQCRHNDGSGMNNEDVAPAETDA